MTPVIDGNHAVCFYGNSKDLLVSLPNLEQYVLGPLEADIFVHLCDAVDLHAIYERLTKFKLKQLTVSDALVLPKFFVWKNIPSLELGNLTESLTRHLSQLSAVLDMKADHEIDRGRAYQTVICAATNVNWNQPITLPTNDLNFPTALSSFGPSINCVAGNTKTVEILIDFYHNLETWAATKNQLPFHPSKILESYMDDHAIGYSYWEQDLKTNQPTTTRHRALKPKTLLFCTGYFTNEDSWDLRYNRWINYYQHSSLEWDNAIIVDDASSWLPDADAISTQMANMQFNNNKISLHCFTEPLPKSDWDATFVGWYRSFAYAVEYGQAHGFDKIIHVESDAYLVSADAFDFFNSFDMGWAAFWCGKHNWPESAFQVINRDQFSACLNFFRQPYDTYKNGKVLEEQIPFTYINRYLKGDRYSELGLDHVPGDADWVSKTDIFTQDPINYLWWMDPKIRSV